MVLKHQRAPGSPGELVGDGWALPCVWFRSGGARRPWCWSRGSAVSISPSLPLVFFSLLDLAKTAFLGEHLPDPNCSILCLTFFIPQIWQFYQVLMSICSSRKISSFGSKFVLLGLLKTLKSTLFGNITHFPCFFLVVLFPSIWRPSLLWSSCRWKHLWTTRCLVLIAEPANFITFPLCTSFLMGQESLLIAATISNSTNCHDWSGW